MKLIAVAIILVARAAAASECAVGQPSCAVCAAGGDVNTVSTLPRLNRKGASQSSNLGDYNWFECSTDSAGKRSCDTHDFDMAKGSTEPTDPENYVESLALYFAVPIIMFLITILFITCFLFWRYMCCCCCRKSGTCKCGASFPTRRRCCMGYNHDHLSKPRYTRCSRITSFLFLFSFLASMVVFVSLGDSRGNKAITTAMVSVVHAPTGFMDLVTGLTTPIANFAENAVGNTLPTLIRDVNATVHEATNIRTIVNDATCVVNKLDEIPSIDTIITFMDDVNSSLVSIRGDIADIDTAVTDLDTTKSYITGNVTDLETSYSTLSTALTDSESALNAVSASVTTFSTLQTTLTDTTTGAVPLITADLTTINDNFPASSDISDATSSGSGSISRLTSGSMDGAGNSAERLTLISRLTALQDTFANQLVNAADTATQMQRYNDAIQAMHDANDVQELLDAVTALDTAIASLPSAAAINTTINHLNTAVTLLDISPIRGSLVSIDGTLTALPRFAVLQAELDKIRPLLDVIPCLESAITQILGLNSTVVTLPSGVLDLLDLPSTINDTLWPAVEQVEDISQELDAAQLDIDNAGVAGYIADVDSLDADLDTAKASLDISSMQNALGSLDADKTVDTSVTSDIQTLNSTLLSNMIDPSLITEMNDLETARSALATSLATAVADLTVYNDGYCAVSPSTGCAVDGDCTSGTCDGIGTRRCEAVPTTACTAHSDCGGGGDRCLVDSVTFATISATLTGLSEPTLGPVLAGLGSVDSASSFTLTTIQADVTAATSAVTGINVAGFETALADVRTSLDELDTSSVSGSLDSVRDAINQVDFGTMRTQLEDVKETVDEIENDHRPDIDDGLEVANALVEFLYDGVLDDLLNSISAQSLTAARQDGGLSSMALVVAEAVDNATAFWATKTTLLDNPTTLKTDLTNEDDVLRYLDILSTDKYSSYGPVHFLAALADYDTQDPADMHVRGVVEDLNGVDYVGDKLCLSTDCLEYTIQEANTQSLEGVTAGAIPLGLSRENLQRVLLVFPLMILLLGAMALLCCAPCCRERPGCQKYPASCMTGCIFIQLPWIFLLAGLPFAMIVGVSDVCHGAANVGFNYAVAYGNDLCTETLDGTGTLSACTVSMDVADRTINATIDIGAMYTGLLGSSCPASDPLAPVYNEVADEVNTLPSEELEDFLNDMDGETQLQEPIKDDLRRAATSLGLDSETFVNDFAESASCDRFNTAFNGVKEAFCCDVVGAMYWVTASWYLMAWSMSLCGCWAGLMARKRLPSRPWGKSYEADLLDNPVVGEVTLVKSHRQESGYQNESEYVSQGASQGPSEGFKDEGYDDYGGGQSSPAPYVEQERPNSRQAW